MYTCIHVHMYLREFIVLKSEILKSLCTQLIHKNIAESQEISAESRVETMYVYMYICIYVCMHVCMYIYEYRRVSRNIRRVSR